MLQMRKRGFTLIEVIVAMSLIFLLAGVVSIVFISYMKTYKNSVVQNTGFNYLSGAISIIEKEVNLDAMNVNTEENVIKIKYSNGSTLNRIKCIGSNIYILYGT